MKIRMLQETAQRLIKSAQPLLPADAGAYERALAASDGLILVREIARWWRVYQLERYCSLSSAWLKKSDRFEAAVVMFYEITPNVPAWIEAAGLAFLDFLTDESDRITAALARFEKALIMAKGGAQETVVVEWPADPYAVLECLFSGQDTPEEQGERFQTVVGPGLEGFFAVYKIENP